MFWSSSEVLQRKSKFFIEISHCDVHLNEHGNFFKSWQTNGLFFQLCRMPNKMDKITIKVQYCGG